jgi:hypothetical protein
MAQQVVVGAQVVLYVNGALFGRVVGFNWNSITANKAIFALDSTTAYELTSTQARVTGNISVVKVHGDGGAEGASMTTRFEDIVREKYFTLQLIDRLTNSQIFSANRCKLTSQSWSVPTRGFVSGSLSFEALEWNGEAPPATP